MKQFRYRPDAYKQLISEFIRTRVSLMLIAALAGIVYQHIGFGAGYLPAIFTGIMVVGILFFVIRQHLSNLRSSVANLEIQLDEMMIAQSNFDQKKISITLTDGVTVSKDGAGNIYIRSSVSQIVIPKLLENIDDVESFLSSKYNIALIPSKWYEKHAFIGAILGTVLFGLIFFSSNILIVLGSAGVLSVGSIWGFLSSFKSPSDEKKWMQLIGYPLGLYLMWKLVFEKFM